VRWPLPLSCRVLQLERQVSILLGDHEQHMLSILNGFKATNEQVVWCGAVLCVVCCVVCSRPLMNKLCGVS
jgi:hypothetical protein